LPPIDVVDPDPGWPARFAVPERRLIDDLDRR